MINWWYKRHTLCLIEENNFHHWWQDNSPTPEGGARYLEITDPTETAEITSALERHLKRHLKSVRYPYCFGAALEATLENSQIPAGIGGIWSLGISLGWF